MMDSNKDEALRCVGIAKEAIQLVRHIKTKKDYYAILGVEKSCTVEEIRKAYRKLSLKVHPDKNKDLGSEEAFKKVSKAFKCLSDGESRRQNDQTGLVDEFEYNQQHNVRRHRRRPENYEDELEIVPVTFIYNFAFDR